MAEKKFYRFSCPRTGKEGTVVTEKEPSVCPACKRVIGKDSARCDCVLQKYDLPPGAVFI